jgi:hypothetical protein
LVTIGLRVHRIVGHHGQMNGDQVAALRELLAPTGWLDHAWYFGRALRHRARTPEGLLVVGTPADEPWHMTAHLADESRLAGLPGLAPTLVRWAPPPGGPAHLSVGIERLESARRDETLLVVSAQAAPEVLLQRLADARKTGTTIFALDTDDPELDGIAHEALAIRPGTAPVSFDAAQHLVSAAAGETSGRGGQPAAGEQANRTGLRGRLARLLDAVSGPPAD